MYVLCGFISLFSKNSVIGCSLNKMFSSYLSLSLTAIYEAATMQLHKIVKLELRKLQFIALKFCEWLHILFICNFSVLFLCFCSSKLPGQKFINCKIQSCFGSCLQMRLTNGSVQMNRSGLNSSTGSRGHPAPRTHMAHCAT